MDESKGPLPLWKLEEVLLEARRELVKQMDFSEEQARRIVEEVARPQLEKKYVIDRRARRP